MNIDDVLSRKLSEERWSKLQPILGQLLLTPMQFVSLLALGEKS